MTSKFDRPKVGDVFRGWELYEDLGDGLSGSVFKVRSRVDPSRTGVIKVHRAWEDGVPEETFLFEEKTMADRPIKRMARFLASGRLNGRRCYVMTYVPPYPDDLGVEEWFAWILELCEIFFELNVKRHIFHRDVKPKNVRSQDGHPMIIDFGLACRNDDDTPYPLERVGSRDFMAPEVYRYEPYTVKAEIYSVAKTVEAIVPSTVFQALSPALAHAGRNGHKKRTGDWPTFIKEIKACIRTYRAEQEAKKTATAQELEVRTRVRKFKTAAKWTTIAVLITLLMYLTLMRIHARHNRSAIMERYGDEIRLKVNTAIRTISDRSAGRSRPDETRTAPRANPVRGR